MTAEQQLELISAAAEYRRVTVGLVGSKVIDAAGARLDAALDQHHAPGLLKRLLAPWARRAKAP